MKISILTPNYNYSQYIGKTIQSVADQNYFNYEHIIIDDGSTDGSVNVIKGYAKYSKGKIIFYHQENQGQTVALNKALSLVSGDIIGWINSDDYYNPGVFQAIVDMFQRNTKLDAIFGDIDIIDENSNTIRQNKYLPFDYTSGVFNGFGKIISSNAIFWKAELSRQIDPFDSNFKIGMDSEYWSRLLHRKNVKHINLSIACFRWHKEAKTIRRKDNTNPEFNWGYNEKKIVFRNSYSRLAISRILPIKYTKPLKAFYKFKRHLLRFMYGHYFTKT